MKRTLLILTGLVLLTSIAAADDSPLAVLYKKDGRAWRVFLIAREGDEVVIRLEKSKANTKEKIEDLERLEIRHPDYDSALVQQQFNAADYVAVIAALEPVAAQAAVFMVVSNNLQEPFSLLMQAYDLSGDAAGARAAAAYLMESPDPDLRLQARVWGVRSALAEGAVSAAENILTEISDPAAQLYARACIERAQQQPKQAIQTAVELIAEHPDDMDWLPPAELLCAELYLDMGMTNSAAAVARQMGRFYQGTYIEKEAEALSLTIKPETGQTE
jgi:hypothetical protein